MEEEGRMKNKGYAFAGQGANGSLPKPAPRVCVLVVPPLDWEAGDRQIVDEAMKEMGLLHEIDSGGAEIAPGIKRVVVLLPLTERGSALIVLAQRSAIPVTISGIGFLADRLKENIRHSN
ncbi:MAG: hypothetical protein NUV59_01290 [Patescibacteria group bacterium]|nr:hypothetical protein [Patescibacteria group bacterium]